MNASINNDEIKVEFNWIVKRLFLCFEFFPVFLLFVLFRDMDLFVLCGFILCIFLIFIGASISFKCNSRGYYFGFNFYFFSFYGKNPLLWEKIPVEISNLLGLYEIDMGIRKILLLRCFFSNFDALAELISHNTIIENDTRQRFIDYVNMRKQQAIKREMLMREIPFIDYTDYVNIRMLMRKVLSAILFLFMLSIILIYTQGPPDFTDSRNDKVYKTVKMPDLKVWFAENLNYAAEGSTCYDNKEENCQKYGRLYDWATALKACPKGWHLPSKEEWDGLRFDHIGYWWTASEKDDDSSHAYIKGMRDFGEYDIDISAAKSNLFSVRCLED